MASERSALEHIRGKNPSEAFRLSREERDHIAGHALDSIYEQAKELGYATQPAAADVAENHSTASTCSRKIAALSNLLGDIGWERVGGSQEAVSPEEMPKWVPGELFPVAQLRPWLEDWQRQDGEALVEAEQRLEIAQLQAAEREIDAMAKEPAIRKATAKAQIKLGTGAILLARIEKWMASHGN